MRYHVGAFTSIDAPTMDYVHARYHVDGCVTMSMDAYTISMDARYHIDSAMSRYHVGECHFAMQKYDVLHVTSMMDVHARTMSMVHVPCRWMRIQQNTCNPFCITADGKNCGKKPWKPRWNSYPQDLIRRRYLWKNIVSAENLDEYNLDQEQKILVTAALESYPFRQRNEVQIRVNISH
ncbi:hypothetical protein AVEN_158093-1 [Araneus ventricosus]|uniref:Uncharacterized protein n=1 Tax=Araneus ventricosus TaxID=182803 RepID=A0A4Y2HU34_ARAVE|nr:hypothetical protein AVEN_158093-1 [Araneus ventricosus]